MWLLVGVFVFYKRVGKHHSCNDAFIFIYIDIYLNAVQLFVVACTYCLQNAHTAAGSWERELSEYFELAIAGSIAPICWGNAVTNPGW